MKNLTIIGAILAFWGLNGCAHLPSNDSKGASLCTFLAPDLDYIHQSMRSNLAVYQIDTDLQRRADHAYSEEKSHSAGCRNDKDYSHAILAYFASYHDPHIKPWWQVREGLRPIVQASLGGNIRPFQGYLQYSTTGLIIKKIGARYYLRAIDSKLFPSASLKIGSELISCDGKTASEIMEREIVPFEQISTPDAGLYNHAAMIFFRWDKVPGSTSRCEFTEEGHIKIASLEWKPVDPSYLSQFPEKSGPLYTLEKTSYGHWVQLRSLAGYGVEETTLLKHFVEDAKKLRTDSILVLDLRGNSGGNSAWGQEWIRNLYGHEPKLSDVPNLIYASPGNIGHYERVLKLFDTTGGFSTAQDRAEFLSILALLHGHPGRLVPLPPEKNEASHGRSKQRVFRGRLWVISDSQVFSSGELFLQMLRLMPKVTQVGIATDASTQAGDIRFDQSPSGLVFSLGTKVFRSIFVGRNPGEPLVPQIPITPIAGKEFKGQDSTREQVEKLIQAERPGH